MFHSFRYLKHSFQWQFFVFKMQIMLNYATQQGILTKFRACEHLQKSCEHEQASTHPIFASNSSKGQILRALSNWMGPFDTPTPVADWRFAWESDSLLYNLNHSLRCKISYLFQKRRHMGQTQLDRAAFPMRINYNTFPF